MLNGSFMFMGDLLRRIPLPLRGGLPERGQRTSATRAAAIVQFDQLNMPDVAGRDVLILDDILDSGRTLHAVRERLLEEKPKSVKICVLLRKLVARVKPVEADYVAFDIADEFVVGYGLDFIERYRNLPCIGVLSEDVIAAGLERIRRSEEPEAK